VEQNALVGKEQSLPENIPRIIIGKVNVMEMNPVAGLQTRKHFQDDQIDLAPGFYRMGRVDKKQAVLPQVAQEFMIQGLGLLPNQLDAPFSMGSHQKWVGVGINANDLWLVTGLPASQEDDRSGQAGPHLNDPFRLFAGYETIKKIRFHGTITIIPVFPAAGIVNIRPSQRSIRSIPAAFVDEGDLTGDIDASDPNHAPRLFPVIIPLEFSYVWNPRIKMQGKDIQPNVLTTLKSFSNRFF
jgi:hypothetical protein